MTTVHILSEGWALCGKGGPPGLWEAGHKWVSAYNKGSLHEANCEGCILRLENPTRPLPNEQKEMSDELLLNVRVTPEGAHERVAVWIRGQHVGALTVGPGDGERIRGALLGALLVASDDPPWLVKDFHALYRTAESTMGLLTLEETKAARSALRAQLDRLRPAFEECEAARVSSRTDKEES